MPQRYLAARVGHHSLLGSPYASTTPALLELDTTMRSTCWFGLGTPRCEDTTRLLAFHAVLSSMQSETVLLCWRQTLLQAQALTIGAQSLVQTL
jgi:hypothetical protein